MVRRKVVQPVTRRGRHQKKSFSLSEEALAYLAAVSGNYGSQSEALDALIRQKKRESERAQIATGIVSYYDSLTDKDMEENRAWGQFAETQFAED
jgi:hypothetical protein